MKPEEQLCPPCTPTTIPQLPEWKECDGSLLVSGTGPWVYIPTVMELCTTSIEVKGEPIELALWDTAAQGDYEDRPRPLSYPDANAFLICFSIEQPDSLDNVAEKWDPEVTYFSDKRIPRFLVGCKKDLRYDQEVILKMATYGQAPVAFEQGEKMARSLGARYFECSARTGEGVRELFYELTETMDPSNTVGDLRRRSRTSRYRWRGRGSGSGCIIV